jgi:hypothetical protein
MKKKFMRWWDLKTEITPKEHANELLISLMLKKDIDIQIQTFEALKLKFEEVLRRREIKANRECRLINSYLPKTYSEREILNIKIKDPIFEQPIKK